MNTAGHGKSNPENPEEEQEFDLDQQDSATWASLIQLTTAGGLTGSKYVQDTIQAFKTVSDENIHQRLLNLQNPEELRKVISDHELIGRRLKNKKKDSTKFAFFRFKGEITRDRYDRVDTAIKIAQHVHQYTARLEESIKADRAISRFALSEENSQQLKKGLSEWREKNPHVLIDDELSRQAKKIYSDHCKKEGKKADGKAERALKNDLLTARDEAILRVTESGVIKRTEEVINNRILDSGQPILPDEQFKQQFDYALQGKKPEEHPASTTPSAESVSQAAKPSSPLKEPLSRTAPPKTVSKTPRLKIGKALSLFVSNMADMQNLVANFMQQIVAAIMNQIISRIKAMAGAAVRKLATKAITKTALALAEQAIGFLLPFLGNAGMAIIRALGLDEAALKLTLSAAKYAVYIVVGVFVYMLIKNSNSTQLVGVEPVPADMAFYQNSRYIAWKNFEEKNLNLINNSASWVAFEKERLDINYRLVNLPLDADRHDDVKK